MCLEHCRTDAEIRKAITDAVYLADGVVLYAAHILGIHRRTMYQLLRELYLWPEVNRIRRDALRRRTELDQGSLLGRARLTLG
jgi:hypothetical protein